MNDFLTSDYFWPVVIISYLLIGIVVAFVMRLIVNAVISYEEEYSKDLLIAEHMLYEEGFWLYSIGWIFLIPVTIYLIIRRN